MSRNVFEIDQGLLGFSLTDPGKDVLTASISDYTAFSCQVTTGALNASANTTNKVTPATWCEPEATEVVPGITSFDLAITFLQDPHIATGINEFLFEHDTEAIWWFMGFAGTDPPKAIGQCTAVAGTIGGDPRTPLVFSVTLPCKGKPSVAFGDASSHVVVGGAATGAVAGTPGHFTPAGSAPPANLAAMSGPPAITASPTTAWTTGEYVVLADGTNANWTGTNWVAGIHAFAAESEMAGAGAGSSGGFIGSAEV
jgi:hypothetical protein